MSRRRAGVSKTTVSRVLNGKGELDLRTAERVRQVIAELGYVPSARAVGLARGRTRIVGMLVPSLTWPWMGEVLQGAVDVVESEGYGLLLFTFNRGEESGSPAGTCRTTCRWSGSTTSRTPSTPSRR